MIEAAQLLQRLPGFAKGAHFAERKYESIGKATSKSREAQCTIFRVMNLGVVFIYIAIFSYAVRTVVHNRHEAGLVYCTLTPNVFLCF